MVNYYTGNDQFLRDDVILLNGIWKFTSKDAKVKNKEILVPFCPESPLSMINYQGFINSCQYEREFVLPSIKDNKILIFFEAVDYEAKVYVNDNYAGCHIGGYTNFSFDITKFVVEGVNKLRVEVVDDIQNHHASGKQSLEEKSHGCFYRRTTGIYRSVYIQVLPLNYVSNILITPDVDNVCCNMDIKVEGKDKLDILVSYKGKKVGSYSSSSFDGGSISIPLSKKYLWEVGNGRLYDIEIKFGKDKVLSYFGLRKCEYKGTDFYINDKKVYQMLVLDQGFYPDGIYTPKSDEEILLDIQNALCVGFNGARLHQKVFDHRYLYYADKLGFIVWQEYPSWGLNNSSLDSLDQFLAEWNETMNQTYNHPSIITWCPLNEAWMDFTKERAVRDINYPRKVYEATKAFDKSRPIVDTSGGYHSECNDLADFHFYGNSKRTRKLLNEIDKGNLNIINENESPAYLKVDSIEFAHLPINLSEYGGMSINENKKEGDAWGYNEYPSNDAYVNEYVKLTNMIKKCKRISGCCYTQLYDVEQETNGIYNFDRTPKLSKEQLKRIYNCNKK